MKGSNNQINNHLLASHERQLNNNKEDKETLLSYTNVAMGDVVRFSRNFRSSDAVCCWGDAPKRVLKSTDLTAKTEPRLSQLNKPSTSNHPLRADEVNEHYSPNIEQGSLIKASDAKCKSIKPVTSLDDNNSPENSLTNSKNPENKGRERLLEWLKSSQAKRDENNRQIFTRWIDRVDSLNHPESMATNFTAATTMTAATLAATSSTEFPGNNPLFAPSSCPSVASVTPFMFGNSLMMNPNITLAHYTPAPRNATLSQSSLGNLCYPTMLSGKSPMAYPNTTPLMAGFSPLIDVSSSFALPDEFASELRINSPSDSVTITPDLQATDPLSPNCAQVHTSAYGTDLLPPSMNTCEMKLLNQRTSDFRETCYNSFGKEDFLNKKEMSTPTTFEQNSLQNNLTETQSHHNISFSNYRFQHPHQCTNFPTMLNDAFPQPFYYYNQPIQYPGSFLPPPQANSGCSDQPTLKLPDPGHSFMCWVQSTNGTSVVSPTVAPVFMTDGYFYVPTVLPDCLSSQNVRQNMMALGSHEANNSVCPITDEVNPGCSVEDQSVKMNDTLSNIGESVEKLGNVADCKVSLSLSSWYSALPVVPNDPLNADQSSS